MTALDRLNAIAATRPLTEQESARLSYLMKWHGRSERQKERDRAKRREAYQRRKDEINAAKRYRYAAEWVYAEKRRFQNRVDYRRRIRLAAA